jgi:hypothetical protein
MDIVTLFVRAPDLSPEMSGVPDDLGDFRVRVEVMLAERGREADDECFHFDVVSPQELARTAPNTFVRSTLLLSEFSWQEIHRHVERQVALVRSCKNWECVKHKVAGFFEEGL